MFIALITLFILTNILIAVYDLAYYRIPNVFLLVLLALYFVYAPLFLTPLAILQSIVVASLAFALGLGLFRMKIIGAGDAKYFTVVALWAGLSQSLEFIFYAALLGSIIGVFSHVFYGAFLHTSEQLWHSFQIVETACPYHKKVWSLSGGGKAPNERDKIDRRIIPFGLAIAGGAILTACLHLTGK